MLRMNIILAILLLIPMFLFGESLDFDSSHQIFHFHGSDSTSNIGAFVKGLGDINNDGYDDIAISSISPLGTYVFLGGNPVDSLPDLFLEYYGRILEIIDYSGDGLNDLVISHNSNIYLFLGHGDYFDTNPVDSILSPPSVNYFRAEASGYVDNDSIGDVLAYARGFTVGDIEYYYANPFVSDKNPEWIHIDSSYLYSTYRSGFIDFDGDNNKDIFVPMRPPEGYDSSGYVYIYCGPSFNADPDYIISPPIGVDTLPDHFAYDAFNVGDINGDGWDDLSILYWVTPLIYLAGPMFDLDYDYLLDGHATILSNGGDVNNDGSKDLIIGGSDTYDGRVILYLGGSGFDGVRDDQIDRYMLPPLFLEELGWRLCSAGDFNGDGYDDILFSCKNFTLGDPGDVFIYSGGNDITVNVNEELETLIPDKFGLHQNHPNPFNLRTEISFEIPRRSWVTVTIYNILGRKVVTLVNKELRAGSYTVNWDGRDGSGEITPSGVYFYRLQAGGYSDTKKMILLK